MNYALVGYGRMGHEIEGQARQRGHRVAVVIDPSVRGKRVRSKLDVKSLVEVDVAFEFTEPGVSRANVEKLVDAGCAVVCGTTGWKPDAALRKRVRQAGAGAVVAPNFSVGMHLFYRMVRFAARSAGAAGFHQPYVFEAHHVGKIDAPSGTALRLAEIVSRGDPRRPTVHAGDPDGRLPEGAVHVASLRVGHEPGRHVVGFDGPFDSIELSHRARGRAGFALGAVLAGEWIQGKTGVFGFDPVLDDLLRSPRRNV